MKLKQLFSEIFRRGVAHPVEIDLPFQIPDYKWRLSYKVPYTKEKPTVTESEVWREETSINAAIEDIWRMGVKRLPPNKFIMHAVIEEKEFETVYNLLFPPLKPEEPSFHSDDTFGGNYEDYMTVVMETLLTNQLLVYGLIADRREPTIYFKPTTTKLLESIYQNTLNKINSSL